MHFKTINKAMLMEKVELHNFAFEEGEEEQDPAPFRSQSKSDKRPKTGGYTRNQPASSEANRPKTSHATLQNNTGQELDFIRGDLLARGERPSTAASALQRIPPIPSSASTPFLAYIQDRRQMSSSKEQADYSSARFQPGSKRFVLPSQF